MPEQSAGLRLIYENLDTAFVNLAALLRWLQKHRFVGHIHVELDEYDADVFFREDGAMRVHERDHLTGREAEGEAALQRLLVRAREPSGLINVHEKMNKEVDHAPTQVASKASKPSVYARPETIAEHSTDKSDQPEVVVVLSGELIAAVERAAQSTGGDFVAAFRHARLALADDYPFLDPLAGRFTYTDGTARLRGNVNDTVFAAGISEVLRRTVEQLAATSKRDEQAEEWRRAVARELAVIGRRRMSALARYDLSAQLERIAGTRVL